MSFFKSGRFFLLLLLLLAVNLKASNSDSLWSIWNDPNQADTSRLYAMRDISWSMLHQDLDSSYILADLLYDLASDIQNEEMKARAFKVKGIVLYYKSDYDSSLAFYKKGLEITQREGFKEEISNLYSNIGMIFRKQGDFDKALEYYRKGLEIRKENGFMKNMASSYSSIGIIFLQKENLPLALENFQKSLKISEESGNQRKISENLMNIGLVYWNLGELDKALEYLHSSMDYFKEANNLRRLGVVYNNIGIIYKDQNELDTALVYYSKGLEISERLKSEEDIAKNQINIGNIYKIKADFDNAMRNYTNALEYAERIGTNTDLASLYFDIGSLHNKFNRFSEARKWCMKAYAVSDEQGYLEEKRNSCECLLNANKGLGNLQKALDYQEELYLVMDTIRELENVQEVTRLAMQYQFDKQHLADSLATEEDRLKAELAYQEDLNAEKMRRNGFMYGIIAVLILAAGLFSRLRYSRSTNRKLAEKNKIIEFEKNRAEELERSKEVFFNNVSHEFRTPLTLIMGPLSNILTKVKSKELKNDLAIMQRNATRLYAMINELLNLYKLESGKTKLKAKKVDIVQFVNRYVQSFESLAKQKNVSLIYQAHIGASQIYIDTEKIEKVLGNLLSNAFKFVDGEGKIKVVVEGHSQKGQDGVKISVQDNGIGIPSEKLEHVFDRFYQVDDSLSRNYEGTGIGLSLTKELVDLHHGTISVKSKLGKGTTFSVFLPAGREHLTDDEIDESTAVSTKGSLEDIAVPENIGTIEAVEEAKAKKSGMPVLLIVEDNPDMRFYIKNDFNEDFKVVEAANGEIGLEKAIQYIPDVIICDIMMPVMDGNAMCEKVKSDERTSHIPLVMLTARAAVEYKIEGLETGADAYLTKPFNSQELQVTVKSLIAQRKNLREQFARNFKAGIRFTQSDVTSMDQQFMEKALRTVEENISDHNFNVEAFGQEMAMSRVQLHRKLRALLDQTSSQFIRTVRLKHAANHLAEKGSNVTETAYEFGFNNMSYFAKCFSEEFGMTPSEYLARNN